MMTNEITAMERYENWKWDGAADTIEEIMEGLYAEVIALQNREDGTE